jgi:hypothetical protein
LKDPTYQLSSNMAMEAFDDGALILHLTNVTFYELNTTARDILKVTDGKNDLRQVAQYLAGEYEIELEVALQDVTELYQHLAEQGIIEEVQPQIEKEG